MKKCSYCGGEININALICKHCGQHLGQPKRTLDINFVVVLCFINFALSVLNYLLFNKLDYYLLGIEIRGTIANILNFLQSSLLIISGIGILKLNKYARNLYIFICIYYCLNTIISIVNFKPEITTHEEIFIYFIIYLLTLSSTYIFSIYTLIRRQDYFTNKWFLKFK